MNAFAHSQFKADRHFVMYLIAKRNLRPARLSIMPFKTMQNYTYHTNATRKFSWVSQVKLFYAVAREIKLLSSTKTPANRKDGVQVRLLPS